MAGNRANLFTALVTVCNALSSLSNRQAQPTLGCDGYEFCAFQTDNGSNSTNGVSSNHSGKSINAIINASTTAPMIRSCENVTFCYNPCKAWLPNISQMCNESLNGSNCSNISVMHDLPWFKLFQLYRDQCHASPLSSNQGNCTNQTNDTSGSIFDYNATICNNSNSSRIKSVIDENELSCCRQLVKELNESHHPTNIPNVANSTNSTNLTFSSTGTTEREPLICHNISQCEWVPPAIPHDGFWDDDQCSKCCTFGECSFEGLEGSCCGPANGELFGFACCSAESMCMEGTDINGGAQYACQAIVAPPGNGATIIVFLLLSFCLASCINCRIYYRNNIYPVFL